MSDIAMQPQGIVLLCGVTGSGKSTTIASMLDYVNARKSVHIVTIEDPIEYIFEDKEATINQRTRSASTAWTSRSHYALPRA
ncbi:MAG: ATPase, T2SS/T4P/T4SS family [Phycisphaerales bacterium]